MSKNTNNFFAIFSLTYFIEFIYKNDRVHAFLFNQYTDIFNRLLRDELDIQLLYQLLETLKKIENGQIDQQEGSVVVGKILHKIFVESAIKHGDNVNMSLADKGELEDNEPKIQGKDISWSKYKKEMLKANSV